jgi:hypothetical protein
MYPIVKSRQSQQQSDFILGPGRKITITESQWLLAIVALVGLFHSRRVGRSAFSRANAEVVT